MESYSEVQGIRMYVNLGELNSALNMHIPLRGVFFFFFIVVYSYFMEGFSFLSKDMMYMAVKLFIQGPVLTVSLIFL